MIALLPTWNFDGPVPIHTSDTTDHTLLATVGASKDTPEAVALCARSEVGDLAYLPRLIR